MSEYRPWLICTEINEAIPPPVLFTVKYAADHFWVGDHFQGQSISKCNQLCDKYSYYIVKLTYNNLFLIPSERNTFPRLTPEDAYNIGYKNRIDRRKKFPQNADVEVLLTMSREDIITFLDATFSKYKGRYSLRMDAN